MTATKRWHKAYLTGMVGPGVPQMVAGSIRNLVEQGVGLPPLVVVILRLPPAVLDVDDSAYQLLNIAMRGGLFPNCNLILRMNRFDLHDFHTYYGFCYPISVDTFLLLEEMTEQQIAPLLKAFHLSWTFYFKGFVQWSMEHGKYQIKRGAVGDPDSIIES